jgi:hypothetical protein
VPDQYTDDFVVVTTKIYDIVESAKTELGLKAVYYGDQAMIPEFPIAAVASDTREKSLTGTHKFGIRFRVAVLVHFQAIQSSELTRKETEEITRAIELKLEEDKKIGGIVAFGYVARIEPGVVLKEGVMIQSTRLVWEALSRKTFE